MLDLDGGPAFPVNDDMRTVYGMTLRDWFAGQVIANTYLRYANEADVKGWHNDRWREGIAVEAYMIADAMIAAREKGGES